MVIITRSLQKKLNKNWVWTGISCAGTKVSAEMLRNMVDNGNGTGYYMNDDGTTNVVDIVLLVNTILDN